MFGRSASTYHPRGRVEWTTGWASFMQGDRAMQSSTQDLATARRISSLEKALGQVAPRRLLLAEDDGPFRYLLTSALRKDGYQIVAVSNGVAPFILFTAFGVALAGIRSVTRRHQENRDGTFHACPKSGATNWRRPMSSSGRSIVIFVPILVGMVHSPPSVAQAGHAQSQASAPTSRTIIDGTFGQYLASPTGAIDGIVLEDGTVARFPLFEDAPQSALLRPGDAVHVEGNGLSGPTGTVLINASVEMRGGRAVRSDIAPTSSGSNPRSHRGRKPGLSASKGPVQHSPQPATAVGRTQGQTNSRNANSGLFLGGTTVSSRKKAHPETIWLKVRHATTGTGPIDNDSQWRRAEETSGP